MSKTTYVVLSCTHEYASVDSVKFIDISEDFDGKDVLTFKCPSCQEEHESYVLV